MFSHCIPALDGVWVGFWRALSGGLGCGLVDAVEFRDTLSLLNLSQAQLARDLSVTPGTVNSWATGVRSIPGPVVAYLDLLGSARRDNERSLVPALRKAVDARRAWSLNQAAPPQFQWMPGQISAIYPQGPDGPAFAPPVFPPTAYEIATEVLAALARVMEDVGK
jgi:hypothetical protein